MEETRLSNPVSLGPFSVGWVADARVSRNGLGADGVYLTWSESRPREGGRQVVVRWAPDGDPAVISPAGVSARSRVHEYGGGAATVVGGRLFIVEQNGQRVVRVDIGLGAPPEARSDVPRAGLTRRYGDGRVTPSGQWLLCVEEEGVDGHTAHRIVALSTGGRRRRVVVVDRPPGGFVASPRPSPDGRMLAWTVWEHPDMPWDKSELWTGDLTETARVVSVTRPTMLAGGACSSVGQPRWRPDGSLVWMWDRTGWWLPHWYCPRIGRPQCLVPEDTEAEFHAPDWVLGQGTSADLFDGSLVCRMRTGGRDHLVRLHVPSADRDDLLEGTAEPVIETVDQPCVTIAGVASAVDGTRIGVLGSTPSEPAMVVELMAGGSNIVVTRQSPGVPGRTWTDDDVSQALPFAAELDGVTVPGMVYLPTDPPEGHPPLVVCCHGGPTGASEPGFDPLVQCLTSRGMAVAAVDYRGSSGYGRAYRRSLDGQWGVADVDDCIGFAAALARAGWVDGTRMAIRGTSAGGMTALNALIRSRVFLGAVSWYGVTDLERLARDTHDFESRYLDRLVGPYPEAASLYRQRSPVHHAGMVCGHVLLLQGADDAVVPLDQAQRFASELATSGVDCHLEVFPGESHGFRDASAVERSLSLEIDFYSRIFR